MIFFVNITLILAIFFISLLFMMEKSIKNYLMFSIICLITIVLNILLVYYDIELKLFLFGLSWNILLPLCQSIIIIALTIINKKYLYLIVILCLFALDLLLKISMTLILNISFIELNSNHFYYFTTYYLICALFIYVITSFILYFIFHNKKNKKTNIVVSNYGLYRNGMLLFHKY